MTDARFMTRAFEAICDCGGRLCGTESERAATALLRDLGAEAAGVPVRAEPFAYRGWRPLSCALESPVGPVPAHPLVRSAGGEVEAEVIDLGRGEPESFAAHAGEIRGRPRRFLCLRILSAAAVPWCVRQAPLRGQLFLFLPSTRLCSCEKCPFCTQN